MNAARRESRENQAVAACCCTAVLQTFANSPWFRFSWVAVDAMASEAPVFLIALKQRVQSQLPHPWWLGHPRGEERVCERNRARAGLLCLVFWGDGSFLC